MAHIRLRLPDDVKAIIAELQAQQKLQKGIRQYSKQTTIFQIIREYKKLKATTPTTP